MIQKIINELACFIDFMIKPLPLEYTKGDQGGLCLAWLATSIAMLGIMYSYWRYRTNKA